MSLFYRALGTLEVERGSNVVEPKRSKVASLLSLFVLRPNQLVNVSTIIDELWGDVAPRTAGSTTQTYVYQLRRLLEGVMPEGAAANPLHTHPQGYVLQIDDYGVDTLVFDRMVDDGRAACERGEFAEAVSLIDGALALWRGEPLSNVTCGDIVRPYVARLEEARLRAQELRIDAMIFLGRHQEVISDLTMLAGQYPLNEWLQGRLIQVLSWSGRRSDALRVYRRLRTNLVEGLGIDPSSALQQLELEVLTGSVPFAPTGAGLAGRDPGPVLRAVVGGQG